MIEFIQPAEEPGAFDPHWDQVEKIAWALGWAFNSKHVYLQVSGPHQHPVYGTPIFSLHIGEYEYNIGAADIATRIISFTAIGIREGRSQGVA